MIPAGKGIQVWNLTAPAETAARIIEAGFDWVAVKAADGTLDHNQKSGSLDMMLFVTALRNAGLAVYGWHYVYGANGWGVSFAKAEAEAAIRNISRFGFDGWLIDAESQYKRKGSAAWADVYMTTLRASFPWLALGLQSYRYPSLHPEIPWQSFLRHVDFHIPQVYWVGSSNPGAQLRRSIQELKALKDLPVIPTGCAYFEHGWGPTVAQLNEFDTAVKGFNLKGVLWYCWDDQGLSTHPDWLAAVKAHKWPGVIEPPAPALSWVEEADAFLRTIGYTGRKP